MKRPSFFAANASGLSAIRRLCWLIRFAMPQNGIRGDVQYNMIETPHVRDERTGIMVYSLYSEVREPTEEMLSDLDTIVVDLQDVGCRIYTFIYTMANCM